MNDSSRSWGGTNFECCFNYMRSKAPTEEGSLAVIFLTDGCGYGDVDRLKTFMQDLKARVGVESEVYCLGVSSSHDANFLNRLAKGGSETGNFIYIDTGKPGYKEEIVGNMNDSLGMVMSSGMKARMNLYKGKDMKLFDFKQCEVEYEYPEKEEEEDQIIEQEGEREWTHATFRINSFLEESLLLSPELYIELQLGPEIKVGESDADV